VCRGDDRGLWDERIDGIEALYTGQCEVIEEALQTEAGGSS